ncbi:MAG: hypothetical protein ACOC3F_00115 [Desulfosudaceae bacterium]
MVSYSRSIPAGGTGKVTIRLNTRGYAGKTLSKVVRVFTNDPHTQVVHLRISGPVESFVTVSPRIVRFLGKLGESLEQRVKIVPARQQDVTITGARADSGKNIAFRLEPAEFPQGPGYWLTVTSTKDEPGTFYDYIYLTTKNKDLPELRIRVHGSIFAPTETESGPTRKTMPPESEEKEKGQSQ